MQILRSMHPHAQSPPHKLIHWPRLPQHRRARRGPARAVEVLEAQAAERGGALAADVPTEGLQCTERYARARRRGAGEGREGRKGVHGGAHALRGRLVAPRQRVHRARVLQALQHRARHGRAQRRQGRRVERGHEGDGELRVDDAGELGGEVGLERAQVERLAEDVEVGGGEHGEDLDGVDGLPG